MARRRRIRTTRKRRLRYVSSRRKPICVCTVCGNAMPKGKLTPAKYVRHIKKHHLATVYAKQK